MTRSRDDHVKHLQEQVEAAELSLKQKKAALAKAQGAVKQQAKKDDDHRLILLGAAVRAAMNRAGPDGEDWKARMRRQLDTFLVRPSDRKLFKAEFDFSEFAPNTAEGIAAAAEEDRAKAGG